MNSIVHRIYRIYIISEEFFSARNESLPRINYSSKLPLGILIYLKEEDTFHYLPPRFLVHLISQVLPRLFPSTTKCVCIYIYIIDPARKTLAFKIYFRSMVAPSWKINFTSLPYPFSMIPNVPLIFRSASYATKMDRVHFPWYRSLPFLPSLYHFCNTSNRESISPNKLFWTPFK